MGSDELTVESGPNGLEVPWSDCKLDSAHTEFINNNPGGRRPGRGATAMHEEDHGELGSCELILLPREQIRNDLSLGVLHDVEEGQGELQARQRAAVERAIRATRPSWFMLFGAISGHVQVGCRSSGVRGFSLA